MILDGAPLIAIHKARYYKRKDGLALGPGPFVTGLEYATDCKATVVGKPEETFFTQVRNVYVLFALSWQKRIVVFITGIVTLNVILISKNPLSAIFLGIV